MKEKISKNHLLMLAAISVWVMIVNAILLIGHIPHGWTIFFGNIFFFMLGADVKKWKELLFGGVFGLICAWILVLCIGVLAPSVGELAAVLIPLTVIVGAIITLGPLFPSICNNVAFAFLTIATIDIGNVPSITLPCIIVYAVGGTIMVFGSYVILRIFEKREVKNVPTSVEA